jgi:hypothetical protein
MDGFPVEKARSTHVQDRDSMKDDRIVPNQMLHDNAR